MKLPKTSPLSEHGQALPSIPIHGAADCFCYGSEYVELLRVVAIAAAT
jgi:hypothetical protein